MSALRQLKHELEFDQRIFWRNPAAVFFTIALPALLLVLLGSVSSSNSLLVGGGLIPVEVYVPAMIALGVAYASFADLSIRLVLARERGTLKRLRGTPLPPIFVVCGSMGSAILLSVVLVAVPILLGTTIFGTELPGRLGLLAAALLVGVPSLAALGFAVTIAIPSEAAAAPIVNAVLLPLYFASGFFLDYGVLPGFLQSIGSVFPLRPLFELMTGAFTKPVPDSATVARDLAQLAAWGLAGLLLALWRFRWVPQGQR